MATVLLTHGPEERRTRFPDSAMQALQALASVRVNDTGDVLTTAQLVALARGCEIVLCDRLTPADREFFAAASDVVALCRSAVDIRNVDLDAARRAGVLVTNASPSFVDAVAELAIGLIIDLARGVSNAALAYRAGAVPPARMGRQLSGATLGVIGYGAIGRRVANLGRAFAMQVLVCDPHVSDVATGIERVDLEALLARSDFVVCLAASTPATDRLLDRAAFARMRPTAWFINLARGPLVDDAALEDALREGRIAGAALDVGNEPGQMPKPAIAGLANVIATPHIGGLTREAVEAQALETVGQVVAVLEGRMPHNALTARHATRFKDWVQQ